MEPLEPPRGYVLTGEAVREIMDVEAELLRSEGIDPEWPGFDDSRSDRDDREGGRS